MNGGLEYWRNGSKSVLGGKRARDASECRRWQSMGFPHVSEQLRWHPRFGITAAAIDSWTCVTGLCEPGWMKASTCWKHESSMMIHHRIFGNLKPFFPCFATQGCQRSAVLESSWNVLGCANPAIEKNTTHRHKGVGISNGICWVMYGIHCIPMPGISIEKHIPIYTSAIHQLHIGHAPVISHLYLSYIPTISQLYQLYWCFLKRHGCPVEY